MNNPLLALLVLVLLLCTAMLAYAHRALLCLDDPACSLLIAHRLLETSLKRAYLIKALKIGNMQKVMEFFERFQGEMTANLKEWEPWFGMSYMHSVKLRFL